MLARAHAVARQRDVVDRDENRRSHFPFSFFFRISFANSAFPSKYRCLSATTIEKFYSSNDARCDITRLNEPCRPVTDRPCRLFVSMAGRRSRNPLLFAIAFIYTRKITSISGYPTIRSEWKIVIVLSRLKILFVFAKEFEEEKKKK